MDVKFELSPGCSGSLYQNEVKCPAFDMEMVFHSMQINYNNSFLQERLRT